MKILFFLVLGLVAAHGASPSTYDEVVSSRMVCNRPGAAVPLWGVLPFSSDILQVEIGVDDVAFAVLENGEVFAAKLVERDPVSLIKTDNITMDLQWMQVAGISAQPGSRLVMCRGVPCAVAVPNIGVSSLACQISADDTVLSISCNVEKTANFPQPGMASIPAAVAIHSASEDALMEKTTILVAVGEFGLFAIDLSVASPQWKLLVETEAEYGGYSITSIAISESLGVVAVGSSEKIWFFARDSLELLRWEWVTVPSTGAGGVVDDAITALAFDDETGVLYIGTPSCLNIRYPSDSADMASPNMLSKLAAAGLPNAFAAQVVFETGVYVRVDGWSGPYANITSLAIQYYNPSSHAPPQTILHIGTDAGVASAVITPLPTLQKAKTVRHLSLPRPVKDWQWSYKFLARYLPGPRVSSIAASSTHPSPFLLVATAAGPMPQARVQFGGKRDVVHNHDVSGGCGVAVFEHQQWTLANKAARVERIQNSRHSRFGMVAECSMPGFGDLSQCTMGDNDNNGLWTAVVVAAEALRYHVNPDTDALSALEEYLNGMILLNNITGIKGLFARSAVSPNETHGAGGFWVNSTTMPGWQFKSDASSDEMVGHLLAFAATLAYVDLDKAGSSISNSDAASYIVTIADYIVKNNFYMLDVTGQPTRWAVWNPDVLNGNRSWSDGRGVNSVEILSLLSVAIANEHLVAEKDPERLPRLLEGWNRLTNSTNQYLQNMINVKIETPCDDNYSDDELTFLPYFSWLAATGNSPSKTADAIALFSIERSFSIIKSLRSDLWGGIYEAALMRHGIPVDNDVHSQISQDIVWNLRTWPLEMIDWPVMNTHRLDIIIDPVADRSGHLGTENVLRVLPSNERSQTRWNSNPHDLDGGNGREEADGGVFLFPYRLAVYLGILPQ